MKLREYILKRLILLIPVLFGVSIVTFILSDSVGDPVAAYIGATEADKITQAQIETLRARLGLDRPILERFWVYVTRLLQGDWGRSPTLQNRPVLEIIADRLPASAELAVYSMILAIAFGIPLGIISAVKKDQMADQVSRLTALSGVSMPIFWLGLMVQIILFNFNTFMNDADLPFNIPYHERLTLNKYSMPQDILFGNFGPTGFLLIDSLLSFDIPLFFDAFLHIFAPSFCLSWVQMAIITRMTRMAMLETMKKDFILLARSKGLTERVIIYRHALRNAIIPTLTVAGLALAGLMTGAVLTETVFDWPGLGWWAVASVARLDTAAIQGFVIITALIYVLSNLAVDILYAVVDPRIRFD